MTNILPLHRKIIDKIQELDFISYQFDVYLNGDLPPELEIKEDLLQRINDLKTLVNQMSSDE